MSVNTIIILATGAVLLIAIMFLCMGIGMQNNRKKKLANCSSITMGKVIKIVKRSYDDVGIDKASAEMFHPVFEYNVGNQKYVKESKFGTTSQKYEIGQEVEIHYNPDNCEQYYVDGDNTQRNLGIIFTVAGVMVLIADVVGAIVATIVVS